MLTVVRRRGCGGRACVAGNRGIFVYKLLALLRATIYFSADIFTAPRMKAAATHRWISEIANEAVRDALSDDGADLDVLILIRNDGASGRRDPAATVASRSGAEAARREVILAHAAVVATFLTLRVRNGG